MAEHGKRADAGAVMLLDAVVEDAADEIEILNHGDDL
jgi:hypothetical protein